LKLKHKTSSVALAAALGFSAAAANAAGIAPAADEWTGLCIAVISGAAWNNTEFWGL
jgi:hypothetical protein